MVSGMRAVASQWKSRNPSSAKASHTGPSRIHLTVDGGSRDYVGKSGIERELPPHGCCNSGLRLRLQLRLRLEPQGGRDCLWRWGGGGIHLLKRLVAGKMGRRITSFRLPSPLLRPSQTRTGDEGLSRKAPGSLDKCLGDIGYQAGPGPRRPPRAEAGCGPPGAGR